MTAPLVPPDADLRDFPFMPVDIVRLFGSEFHTTATDSEWRAGVTLWLKSFHQVPAASLPADDASLTRLAELGRDVKSWKKVKAGALRGWVLCDDGRYYHRVVAEKALEAWIEKLTHRKVSAAGNAKKHSKPFDPAPFDEDILSACDLLAQLDPGSRVLRKRLQLISQRETNGSPADLPTGSQETGTGTEKEKESSLRSLSTREIDAFADEFLEAYPKPEEPYAAREKFAELVRSGVNPRTIVDAAKAYAEERKGQEPRWTKKPAKWLEAGGYVRAKPAAPSRPVSEGVYVEIETPQWAAWEQHYRATHQGRGPPTDKAGKGWFFPTEWPPNARAEHAA